MGHKWTGIADTFGRRSVPNELNNSHFLSLAAARLGMARIMRGVISARAGQRRMHALQPPI
jgi:hypothetical protein